MNGVAIQARDVRKAFRIKASGRCVQAVDGVTFAVPTGMISALVGPDGAGKTTLLRMICGLTSPEGGSLQVLGIDPAAHPQDVQDRISYMPQRFGLYEDLTVRENMELYADLHCVPREEREERNARLLAMMDLDRFTQRLAGRLSGGMKQKLGLACTLVRAPDLLLLDEPTAGVDPLSRRELWGILKRLEEEESLTVLVSTAYLDEAALCRQVFVMHEGRLIAEGSPDDLASLAAGRCFDVELPAGTAARTVQAALLDDTATVADAVPAGGLVHCMLHRGVDAEALHARFGLVAHPVPPALEDGFMLLLREQQKTRPPEGQALKMGEAFNEPFAKEPSGPSGLTSPAGVRGCGGRPAPADSAGPGDLADRPEAGAGAAVTPPDCPPRAAGEDAALNRRTHAGTRRTEEQDAVRGSTPGKACTASGDDVVIEVRDLVKRFGSFTAVDSTSFCVHRGEIFGLLGPNGAGKTTTFRMLCGLLPATSGLLRVAGNDLRTARSQARASIGYVAQKFSLYGALTVEENLQFFGGIYNLHGRRLRERIATVRRQFDLREETGLPCNAMPGGFRQRLAMAAGLLHEPQILFLDEPTSGIDALARRAFWRQITELAAGNTTVIITTHFMEEAEYCDRMVIQDAGKILALGTPGEVRRQAGPDVDSMEEAFIRIVERHRAAQTGVRS